MAKEWRREVEVVKFLHLNTQCNATKLAAVNVVVVGSP